MSKPPVIYWMRRDFRLADNAALIDACADGAPVVPVLICDAGIEDLGAAPKWRLGLTLEDFAKTLQAKGSRLIFRRGAALAQLQSLIAETGAQVVVWNRLYDAQSVVRDTEIKSALTDQGVDVRSHAGHLLQEPWDVQTASGTPFKVYSPFWRALSQRPIATTSRAPEAIPAPSQWPASDDVTDWSMGQEMNRGAAVVSPYLHVGEKAAQDRLARFLDGPINTYKAGRDFFDQQVTSGLSENLTYGEISPRQIWHAGQQADQAGAPGAEHFLKELAWRDFAHHLHFYAPKLDRENWREGWEAFAWRRDPNNSDLLAWQQGQTGNDMVDAAMRELYTTGVMHNRARMITASYLTKHLLIDWRLGLDWFADCLVDWDPASNAMGWQWVAGCGPDAAPFFRVFNPDTQAQKFDSESVYRDYWLRGEGHVQFLQAAPRAWSLPRDTARPTPIVDLKDGRVRALAAYQDLKSSPA